MWSWPTFLRPFGSSNNGRSAYSTEDLAGPERNLAGWVDYLPEVVVWEVLGVERHAMSSKSTGLLCYRRGGVLLAETRFPREGATADEQGSVCP